MAKAAPAQPDQPPPVPPPGRAPPAEPAAPQAEAPPPAYCQLCGTPLFEIHGKLQCPRCRTIWESCCEGGRWP